MYPTMILKSCPEVALQNHRRIHSRGCEDEDDSENDHWNHPYEAYHSMMEQFCSEKPGNQSGHYAKCKLMREEKLEAYACRAASQPRKNVVVRDL
jgi:hypothetical protein